MAGPLQWLRSAVFVGQMYVALAVVALGLLPAALVSRRWAYRAVHAYCGWVRWTARAIAGLETEIRGTPPEGVVLVAAKHHSFLDIILIAHAVPRPKFVMKRALGRIPVFGWYARRIGCVAVDRGGGGRAIESMLDAVAAGRDLPGQLIIYPQGTRVAPDARARYKSGAGAIYGALGAPCVPAATNAGVFWPRRALYRAPGRAVVEFLEPVPAGRPVEEVMATLESRIERASDRLVAEARAGDVSRE